MEYLQWIDPWLQTKSTAAQSYRVEGSLFTVPFVLHDSASKSSELTSIKSSDEFFKQFRQLPEEFFSIFDEKRADSLELNPPVKLTDLEMEMYFRESSSQHMSTLLDGVEAAGLKLANADILVTSETLNRIAGTVFQQQNSWRLRASVEYVFGKNIIVICDDDSEEEAPPTPSIQFFKERLDALVLAQSICESHETNKLLHGAHAVESTICDGEEKLRMVVMGEVDLIVEKQPVNTFVSTGIGRSNRVALGSNHDVLNTCYEYLWSRSFWLGIGHSLFGMRPADDGDVQFIQRFSLTDFFRQHRHRNNKMADVATNCVARCLINLKKAILTNPRENWILKYDGRAEDVEPGFVAIQKASESWSFLLIREKFHMIKREMGKLQKQENAHFPAQTGIPHLKTRKVLVYGRTSSYYENEPIVVLNPSVKQKPEKRIKKSRNHRKIEPPMMIMIKVGGRTLSGGFLGQQCEILQVEQRKSITIDVEETNDEPNPAEEFKTLINEQTPEPRTPRRFHSISSFSNENLEFRQSPCCILDAPRALEVPLEEKVEDIIELSKDVEHEYIPFLPSISEGVENENTMKNEDVDHLKIEKMYKLSKDEDVEYVKFVVVTSEDTGIQMRSEEAEIQNLDQIKKNLNNDEEKYVISSKSRKVEKIPFSKNVKKASKRKRSPSFCGPELPPSIQEKERKTVKRSHSEKYESKEKKRQKIEKEREKLPKHRRIESPMLDFQKHQRPLLKQSFSLPSASTSSEKYKEKNERQSLRYRQPPPKEHHFSRRNEHIHHIPVNVRTVNADSRSSTVYRRHSSKCDY